MTPSDIKACEAHEDERAAKNEEFERKIDAMLPDEIAEIAKNASKWVCDQEEDPGGSLAVIYRQAAQQWNAPEQIGYFVKAFLDGKMTGILAARIERKE